MSPDAELSARDEVIPDFGAPRPSLPPPTGLSSRPAALALLGFLALLALMPWAALYQAPPPAPLPVPIELQGEVPQPGFIALADPTLHKALAQAGLSTELPDQPLHRGDAVRVQDGVPRVVPASAPLVLGLKLDPNLADPSALEDLPGVGPSLAQAIVEDRQRRGPFYTLADLDRVKGIGPAKLAELAPYLRFGDSDG